MASSFIIRRTVYVYLRNCNFRYRILRVVMFRIVAIWLVALAAFDLYFLDGKHIHTVEAVARSLVHMMIG